MFPWILVLLPALGITPAAAQNRATTADVSGVVMDQLRASLPGAKVTATNPATNLERVAITEADGRFSIPALPPGTYILRAERPGFTTEVNEDIALTVGEAVLLDFVLSISGIGERITVPADSPQVDPQKTVVGTFLSQDQIGNLPINGRNFISFSVITAGVNTDRTPQQGASATSGLTFAGQRARSNNITVDGLDNNDASLGGVRATFSQEAVREFQVLTNSYSAEFGKASGGVVNIVTKSGTNMLSGNAFMFFRDDALNAREHFEKFDPSGQVIDRPKAPYSQKQFGTTLGGPIRKDKTFYFLSFERLDITANNFVTIDDTSVVSVFGTPYGTPAAVLRRAGFSVETGNVPYDIRTSQFLAKVDHQFEPNRSLNVRYNYGSTLNENIEPFGGIVARSRGAALDATDHMLALSHTGVFSRLVHELRFQYARRDQSVNALDPRCGGPCLDDDQGGPTLEIPGLASVGRHRFTPQIRISRLSQVVDTLSYDAGRHQFKAGVDFGYAKAANWTLPLLFGGRFIFQPISAELAPLLGLPGSISAVQALALNLPIVYAQGYGNPRASFSVDDLSLFAQDSWTPRSEVTLKLGLRYQKQFWPDYQINVRGIAPYGFPTDSNNLAPRLSLAWDPKGDRKTSIHGSYGIFHDNHVTLISAVGRVLNGSDGVRILVATGGSAVAAFRSPGHMLLEPTTPYQSLAFAIDPALSTPYAHHVSGGIDRELPGRIALSANFVYARGHDQLGTIDYNPITNPLTGNRPEDGIGGNGLPVPGSSASVLQYTTFGETWFRGLTLSAARRLNDRYQFLVSYALSKAEDNSTDFQSAFIPENNGRGRDKRNPTALPIGFSPDDEKGPSAQDQRHRFVISGIYVAPRDIQFSTIITVGSGRPYNILAGADLNGDGNGGAFPPDRARANPADPASSVARNSGTLPSQATVDLRASRRFRLTGRTAIEGIFEVFNLFNRTNYELTDNGPNIFGTGAYPTNPLPTFGKFTQAGQPRQVQVAAKVSF